MNTLWIDEYGVESNVGAPYGNIDVFFMLEGNRKATYFMAQTKMQFSYIIDYCKRHNVKCNVKASNGTEIFSLSVGPCNFRSVDYVFNKPFMKLVKEFKLDYGAKGVEQLVELIEKASAPYSFIGKEYLTISKLAMLNLEEYAPKDYINWRYPCSTETLYKFIKDNDIYRGGINFLNENFKNKELNGIYKYDKNSYFAYIMKHGNLPVGHRYLKKGKPEKLQDVLVHVRLTGGARFEGIYPYKNRVGSVVQFFLEEEIWIWADELKALMNYYDFIEIDYIEYYEWLWNKPDEQFGKFVDHFFEQKKTSTGVRRYFVKRILNGAYGKLGQSPIRSNFKIKDGKLVQTKEYNNYNEKYSVVVASKITALARAWLLNDIYAATDGRPDLYFVYCDTDSMMLLKPIQNTGDDLGDYKDEGPEPGKPWAKAKYLGCKCYMLYDGAHYECHAAGVNKEALEREVSKLDWNDAMRKFTYGETFYVPTLVTENGIKITALLAKKLKNLNDFEIDETTWNSTYGVYENNRIKE